MCYIENDSNTAKHMLSGLYYRFWAPNISRMFNWLWLLCQFSKQPLQTAIQRRMRGELLWVKLPNSGHWLPPAVLFFHTPTFRGQRRVRSVSTWKLKIEIAYFGKGENKQHGDTTGAVPTYFLGSFIGSWHWPFEQCGVIWVWICHTPTLFYSTM